MPTGTVVIINGTSSSGKTSIVRAFQGLMDEPYLDAGIDRFIWMLPKRYLDRPLWDEVLGLASHPGHVGCRLMSGMHRAIADLAAAGNNIVADHVLVEPAWLDECVRLFAPFAAYLVGIRCPLPVLEGRERLRKDRTLGQARAQFSLVHAHGIYDVKVDTSILTPEECALRIKARMEDGSGPRAFRRLRDRRTG
jgi:chloramphenicol 3-O phosphotransferase